MHVSAIPCFLCLLFGNAETTESWRTGIYSAIVGLPRESANLDVDVGDVRRGRFKRQTGGFTAAEIDQIVQEHNELRRLEGASDMEEMVK